MATRDFCGGRLAFRNTIVGLCAPLITEQIKGKAAIPDIGSVEPTCGHGGIKIAHRRLGILELDHCGTQGSLDHRILRSQRFGARKKTGGCPCVTQDQRSAPGLTQGKPIAPVRGNPAEGFRELALRIEPRRRFGVELRA